MRGRIILLMLMLTSMASSAENSITLGYCNGEMATSSDYQLTGKGYQEAAVYLRASALKAYTGNSITTLRVALVARVNIDTLHVWVRDGNMEETLAKGTITRNTTPKISKGWNEVALDTPLPITDDMGDILIGFTIHQNSTVKTISVVGQPMDNTSFIKLGDNDWQDISDKGVLSIEAIVSGENIARYDYGFVSMQVAPNPSASPTALQAKATIHNYGTEVADMMRISCATDGVEPISVNIRQAIPSTRSELVVFGFDPGVETDENNLWTFTIESLGGNANENADENPDNNTIEAKYTYQKNVLVEEFTTEQCVNCPRVAGFLHNALAGNSEYDDRVFAVCHHAGYYTDWLTKPCDEDLTWLYNNGNSLYAPAVMINRQPYFDINGTTKKAPVFIPSSADELSGLFDSEMMLTANAIVGVSLTCNDDTIQVAAHVTMKQNGLYKAENPTLTLYLTEDDVKARNQIGADGVYMQQHVIRAYNSSWGEAVAWEENVASYDYTFNIDSSWDRKALKVVAVLANYNATDATDCVVENSACTPLVTPDVEETPTAIREKSGKETSEIPVAAFDVLGRRLPSLAPGKKGLTVVRYSDGSAHKLIFR